MNINFKWLALSLGILAAAPAFTSCEDKDDVDLSQGMLKTGEENTVVIDAETLKATYEFTSRVNWTVTLKDETPWLEVSPERGAGGIKTITFTAQSNNTGNVRSAIAVITAGEQTHEITVTQEPSEIVVLNPEDVQDLDKYYKPQEFTNMDMLRSDSKWSWVRSKQSDHFFVFWEAGFGADPNSEDVPQNLRVDIDDLLEKAERFYETNINTLKMANVGQGASNLDKYKMEIYLLYQTEWLATGSGYDNMIGALWVNPSTCQPVGSVIAHEIGHSFQYQVYCDKVANGAPDDALHGFRYGYPDSNGGNAFWEQCAQWQSFQDYPEEQFDNYYFDEWVNTAHRHFEHEWHRYSSYWLQSYWVAKHGVEAFGNVWRESQYPDDPIETYTKLYNGGDYQATREELYDYASRMATFDIDGLREYAANYQGRYQVTMLKNDEGGFQPAYASCPGATGFNVIALNVPEGGGMVSVDFAGLPLGSPLLAADPGKMIDGDGKVLGTTTTYNVNGSDADMGWRYGFVAYANGKRTYSETGKDRNGTLMFNVPADAEALYLVVQGSPESYKQSPWDEVESTDYQYPYSVKFAGTNLLGHVEIDPTKEPTDIALNYDFNVSTDIADYYIGEINLGANQALCQAFVMSSDVLEANMLTVGKQPAEGKVAVMNMETDGSLVSAGLANNGFWLDADGNNSSWGDNGFTYFEVAGLYLSYGHFPGHCEAGKTYQLRPVLVYTKGGKQYKATITINLKY